MRVIGIQFQKLEHYHLNCIENFSLWKAMKIAVLEDDPADQFFIYQSLRDGGHECDVYSTGRELQRELKKQTFDLLVLD
jgi:DNA-binding NtrC family response regulator